MASITSIGIGSGLDAESIITQFVNLEKNRLTTLKNQATLIETRLSTVSQMKSLAATLEDKLKVLSDSSNWANAMAASSSNSLAITATTGNNAVAGNYSVEVTALAVAQTITSGQFGANYSLAAAGSISISINGSSAPSISIEAGSSLAEIANAINKASTGVSASILNDGTGQRLVLTSTKTGTDNSFTINGNGGLAGFSYDKDSQELIASKEGGPIGKFNPAADAEATVNGVSIKSSSNSFENTIQGLTFTANTTGTTTLSINPDTAKLETQIKEFVAAYNALNSILSASTKYEESTNTAGIFQGDSTIVNLQNTLRRTFANSASISSVFQRLADVGIDIKTGGSMSLNENKLKEGLSKNSTEMARFFAEGNDGFADKMLSYTKTIQYSGSILANKSDALTKASKRNTQEQDKVELRASAVEARLRAQYGALDTKMATLSTLSNYVEQQIAQWNKSSN